MNDTLFLLKPNDTSLYDILIHEYRVLLPLVYETEGLELLTKNQLKTIFFALFKPESELFINSNLAFMQSFEALFIKKIMHSQMIKQYHYKLNGHGARSFVVAIFIANCLSDCVTKYIQAYPERMDEIRLLITHINTDLEGLFSENFQSIQPYPKDIMVANANIVKYFMLLFASEEEDFEGKLKNAYFFGNDLYENVLNELD